MAFLQVSFYSECMRRTVPIDVILPVDSTPFSHRADQQEPLQTLYLLHGSFGGCDDWIMDSRIRRWAEKAHLCVVMPSGDNGFYVDQPAIHNYYGEYVGNELVQMTRKMFPLSHKREDTFIGGLSMGGYGAVRNGLKYHETFGAIIGLSCGFLFDNKIPDHEETLMGFRREYFASVFGDLEHMENSDMDPRWIIDQIQKEKEAHIPAIYLAAGTEDELTYKETQIFRKFLESRHVPFTYEEGPGGHNWDFWDAYMQRAMNWLPLKNGK